MTSHLLLYWYANDNQISGVNVYTKGGADATFASAKVKTAIGRIGIFLFVISGGRGLVFTTSGNNVVAHHGTFL